MYSRTARVSTVRWNLKEAVSESLVRRTEIAYKAMVAGGIAGGICGRAINKKIDEKTVDKLFIALMVLMIVINIYNIFKFM